MDLLGPLKGMFKNKTPEMEQAEAQQEQQRIKLEIWKKRLNTALSSHDGFRNDTYRWDLQYHGTHMTGLNTTTAYMSDKGSKAQSKDARQVVNLTYQLIESEIDISVPKPVVDALEDGDQDRKEMVEGMLTYMSEGPELIRLTSENERIVKKNSMGVIKVMYDPDYDGHSFKGKIKTTNPHPNNVIPQPNVFRVKDMEYLFQIENMSIDRICREYGEEFRMELEEEHAEFSFIDSFTESNNISDSKGMLSVVEAWYLDNEGDVCQLVWCSDTILKDMPKFYYKRDEMGQPMEYEQLQLSEPMEIVDPESGQLILQDTIQVKCHIPKTLPYIIQYNVPREKSFRGKSDCEVIADQQETIKKILSIQEEKLLKGTSKILTRKGSGLKDKLTDAVSQILETDDPVQDIKVIDLKTPDSELMNFYTLLVQAGKDSLGITEASQGRSESGTLSGKALELLSQNTANRMSTKIYEKQVAYMELYRLYYDFLLAYYDDPVPYRVAGIGNEPKYGYFDKSLLAKQDASGEYYYPTFDIYINVDSGLPKDKNFILEAMNQALQMGAVDAIEYWTVMESIDFPCASMVLEMEQQKLQQMQMQQGMMGDEEGSFMNEFGQLSPDEQNAIMNLSPEQQEELMHRYRAKVGTSEKPKENKPKPKSKGDKK